MKDDMGIDVCWDSLQVFDGREDRTFPNQPGLLSFVSFLERKHPQGFQEVTLIFEPTRTLPLGTDPPLYQERDPLSYPPSQAKPSFPPGLGTTFQERSH